MPRALRILASLFLFAACYAVFLYWVFPYDALKDRVFSAIEQQLGGGISVSAKSFEPYWLTGADIGGLSIEGPGPSGTVELLNVKRVRARASILSLLVGSKRLGFDIALGKGSIDGTAKLSEDVMAIDVDIDELDVADAPIVEASTGLKFVSRISGTATLAIDRSQPVRTSGTISIAIDDLKIASSTVTVAGTPIPLPDLQIAKGRESQIKISIGKGTATFEECRFANGDLTLDLKGKVFLSNKFENYRLNMNGSFAASQKLSEALPFLFIVDSQKQEDGSYPLSITGRLAKPSIKIGTFTVPM
jgi:type II secretion system protein N